MQELSTRYELITKVRETAIVINNNFANIISKCLLMMINLNNLRESVCASINQYKRMA